MQVQIVVQSDDGKERNEIFSADGPISIGRHPQCVLCLDSDLVSRQHAVVDVGIGVVRVEDLSTNGTLAGEKLLRRTAIEVGFGTPIVVGNFTIYIFALEEAAPRPPAAPSAATSLKQTQRVDLPPPPLAAPRAPPPSNGALPPSRSAPPTRPPAAPKPGWSTLVDPVPPSEVPMTTRPPVQRPRSTITTERPAAAIPASAMTPEQFTQAIEARKRNVDLRRKIHKLLLEHLDLATIDAQKLDDPSMRPKVLTALRRIVEQLGTEVPPEVNRDTLIGELADEALGLGPLERFLADPSISEIMVVDPSTIYVEKGGKIILSEATFTDDERVRGVIERIVTPLGRRIDESSPLVDARLKDGSRVNAVIRPIALRGSCITIRKFARTPLALDNLIGFGALTQPMAQFLCRCVIAKRNIIISGGTGSGKTTLLNVLSAAIPEDERIVTIEDAAELQLKQPHVVSLETRPANLEGKGEYTIRDLVKNALRMRPDRIVVGECRGGEALDMLQAMNTGHDGSLTTTHANSPIEAIARIETLVLMAGVELPVKAIREQIANSIHIVTQVSRLSDGQRKVTAISEVTGMNEDSHEIEMRPIFEFVRTGTGQAGKVVGEFRATGYLPSFLNDFIVMGLIKRGESFLTVTSLTELFRWGSVLFLGVGLFGVAWATTAVDSSFVWRLWTRYTVSFERKLRPMFIWTPGRVIGLGQFAAAFMVLVAEVLIEVPFWPLWILIIAVGPAMYVEHLRRERVKAIEKQLDGFLLALANALKSTPSIGAGFQSIQGVIQPPMQQEVELAVKEMKVGSTLDQALLHMAARVGSHQLDSALSSILIGRQVGGNLPKVLETTSQTLREMARLDGVIRTKTAEGKMQLWVIGLMPLLLVVLFNSGFPGYLETLTGSLAGYTILIMAAGMWLAGLLAARKVLSIDI